MPYDLAKTKQQIQDLCAGSTSSMQLMMSEAPLVTIKDACGFLNPKMVSSLFCQLAEYVAQNPALLRKRIVAIGSGQAFLEKCFQTIGFQVDCYDKTAIAHTSHDMKVNPASFPGEISKVLPADCRDTILFCGYPQGFLGKVLEAYQARGGTQLITLVERVIENDMHGYMEPDEGACLGAEIRKLRKPSIESDTQNFSIKISTSDMLSPGSLQFYNFEQALESCLTSAKADVPLGSYHFDCYADDLYTDDEDTDDEDTVAAAAAVGRS